MSERHYLARVEQGEQRDLSGEALMNSSAGLTTLTRVGFATRGALYIVIAILLLRAGREEDPAGALRYLETAAATCHSV